MKRFQFKFAALLTYRRHRRDLCQRLLADLQAHDQRLIGERQDLERQRAEQLGELRNLATSGAVDVDRALARRYFAARLTGEMRIIDRNRDLLARQIQMCRQTLLRADQEVRALEKLREQQIEAHGQLTEKLAARELEEAWQAARQGKELEVRS